ncbi:hypothetical protein [Candidatus Pollutiaquabacter sp.]|uniref:hypothetical protein n=1 Tax=Candidatus Pollutiaquabacter sp. TaxID=3416354 RepID=UPI003D0D8EB8
MALQQMRGGFSRKIKDLRAELIHFASLIELELDFPKKMLNSPTANKCAVWSSVYVANWTP